MAGMKKAGIPAGLRRGQHSPPAPAPEPTPAATPAPARRRSTSTSGSASGRTSARRSAGAKPAVAQPRVGGNPYAGEKRRPMNHLVYEGISGKLRALSEQLIEQGYPARSASQAQLANAVLHFAMPPDVDAAGELVGEWMALTAVPIPSNPYAGEKRRPMNHLVYEGISGKLRALSEQLIEQGYPARSASQAQLANAALHAGMPADLDAAGELVHRWMLVTAAGPTR